MHKICDMFECIFHHSYSIAIINANTMFKLNILFERKD